MQNTEDEPNNIPTEDKPLTPFETIVDDLRFMVKTTLGLADEDFSIEVASFDNIEPAIRIRHKKVLVGDLDWMAIVSLVDVWSTKDGRTRKELSDPSLVSRRYLQQVVQKDDFGLFREGLQVSIRRVSVRRPQFYRAAPSSPRDDDAVQEAIAQNAAEEIIKEKDKEIAVELPAEPK